MYNCVGSAVLGSSVELFLGVSTGGGTGQDKKNTVGMSPRGAPVASMDNGTIIWGGYVLGIVEVVSVELVGTILGTVL